jgi:hypothetical protein
VRVAGTQTAPALNSRRARAWQKLISQPLAVLFIRTYAPLHLPSADGTLPPDLNASDVAHASAVGAYRWTALMRAPGLASLAMGTMVDAMVGTAEERREGGGPLLALWSGHDSTLFGLLAALELSTPSVWPEYGARLTAELLADGTQLYWRFSLSGREGEGQVLRSTLLHADTPEELISFEAAVAKLRGDDQRQCRTDGA